MSIDSVEGTQTTREGNLPGEALKTWQLIEPIMRYERGREPISLGVRDGGSGQFYGFNRDEELVFQTDPKEGRVAQIRMIDGSLVGFKEWRMIQKREIAKSLEEVGGEFEKIFIELLESHPHLAYINVEISNPDDNPTLEKTAGFWKRPEDVGEVPVIVINGNPETFNFKELLETRNISAMRAADLMGISYEQLESRPDILGLFVFSMK